VLIEGEASACRT